ncbi:ARF guanine-nucleotide exchange factor GNL2-like [Ipomoea triloba]|uniref:ARF guanine-nucleotide exchange factor GNL2-like n=1 Tax=Ipomoea triloba TaxID=35885 RepID=UPI00125E63C6|nr:ARF guanine-nucleotide exchange factor GNL2-like [Ipomoea triloba]
MTRLRRKELGISCMLNTEVGAVLAVLRRSSDGGHYFAAEECYDTPISQSLKSLRALIFNPQQEWRNLDPSLYLLPFLDVIQNDEAPAAATGLALSSVFKILKLEIFDHKTPGVREAINSSVAAITSCRLEKTDPVSEDAVMMKILQVLTAIMAHSASIWLTDQAVCTVVNSCFQVVQQSASRGDLLQRSARFTMHELVHIVYSRLPEVEVTDWENSESDTEDSAMDDSGYGIRAAVDIFHFLCSLLNVVEVVESDGVTYQTADESIQLFALVLINSAIVLSGDSIGMHPKLLRMIQDDLFHHLIHYGSCSGPLVLSMICSIVLNIYHFLRRSVRLQLEAFFSFVLFKVAGATNTLALQEVAVEGLINFCRQPTFVVEAYVNYDCDPTFRTVFEDTGKLLCRHAYPSGGALTSLQLQSFEGLSTIIHNIADNIDREGDNTPSGPYPVEIGEYRPFWEERVKEDEDLDTWIDFVRVRKAQKRKILIAGDHFSRDEKKGLEYLKHSGLVSNSSDPKAYAMFFRYTPKLDKTAIGDFLGDPEDFHLNVLKEFTDTFEFTGMVLDNALRTYLESFRLPGESQKIQRVLEAFAERFYEQQSSEIFYSKDAVFILCYSVIMLNTDQHNPQVKKKMTEDEFIRNNRAINSGQDLPREYLSELFQSISANAILFDSAGTPQEMSPNQWIQLINRSKRMNPYIMCDFDRRLGRDLFASIAGPSVATLAAIFEQADEEEVLHECIEALFSIARICQYGLDDTLDELVCTFCKFTTLLNPYASAEETLYAFSNDMKPRMATLAVFTIANNFKNFIRGGWRTIVDCLLKLKKLKLLPQSVVEPEAKTRHERSASTSISASQDSKFGRKRHPCGVVGRFSQFLSMDNVEESLNMGVSEFENNLKIISQCRIGSIFNTSSSLPEDTVQNLGRSLIYSAAGKGQKFSTAIEEEETVGFCWDLIVAIASANINRLPTFWPYYHEYLLDVAQYPLFSPIPFAEKAIVSLMKICLKLLSSFQADKAPEELIFKSINLMWKLEKEILDTCSEFIVHSVTIIMNEYPANLQTVLGWKSVLHLLSITGRHPEMYDQKVEAVINLMSDGAHISRLNYPFCIETAFGFVALKNSPLEKNIKIMDLMSNTVTLLVNWFKSGYSDPGGPSSEENKALMSPNFTVSCFVKLGEAFRKTSLSRREEIRNHAVISLQKSFSLAEDLGFTPSNIVNCFKLVIFAMVDDLHEKMLEYSKRENAERETRGMEGTLKLSMEMLTGVYLQYLKLISESPDFRGFWMGVLRRMDTCMKADLGEYGESRLQDNIPELLKKMVSTMKEKEILVQKEDDDLWEMTYIQIQWIAPSLKEELFPDN